MNTPLQLGGAVKNLEENEKQKVIRAPRGWVYEASRRSPTHPEGSAGRELAPPHRIYDATAVTFECVFFWLLDLPMASLLPTYFRVP
eukprot:5559063-Prymnesium_polylepis.1